MKKVIVWALVLLSLLALTIRFSSQLPQIFFGIQPKSGISITSTPDSATVYVEGKEVGKTPFNKDDFIPNTYLVKIEKDSMNWQGKVTLNANTISVVNRDLAKDQTSSSGEVLTLEKGKGITVVSNPTSADVEVDGKVYGKTPITAKVESGEHNLLISHPSYLKRNISAKLPEGFNLTISLDLAISEADLTTFSAPVISKTTEVIVKKTPTNFLRVRDKASLSGKEIAQVKVGDTLTLLSEEGAWYRVRLLDGLEGYVSASYVEKKVSP